MASRRAIKKRQITRDCWDLDFAFFKWLDERIPVYYKDAKDIVDLTFNKIEFRGETLTQEEAILRMLKLLDIMHNRGYWDEGYTEQSHELLELWSIIAPAMWW